MVHGKLAAFRAVAVVMALLVGAVLFGARGLGAQDATPAADDAAAGDLHPAHIHSGDCVDLGDVVAPLTDVAAASGETVGAANAVVAETSVTNVPLALDAILAAPHAINVHLSTEEIGTYIACGEIGGVLDANGALTIGLREVDGSGEVGFAFLAASADPATTDVSLFLKEDLFGGGSDDGTDADGDAADGDDATPAADAGAGGVVEVSLSEFVIDMPTELTAGSTTFQVSNTGEFPHNIEIEGNGIEASLDENLEGGESGELTVDLPAGTYTVYCPVGNHRGQGMELEVTVS